jgi:hypothetical protein
LSRPKSLLPSDPIIFTPTALNPSEWVHPVTNYLSLQWLRLAQVVLKGQSSQKESENESSIDQSRDSRIFLDLWAVH